ncbi:hypothetical protein RJ640_004457 [Escallonia rubra]|uniref:Cytochrome c oxidase copper chaperone n=1 Tax=Escallonia rubra TaxID=112253 RepID=A0AA88QPF1_9ASTE|nr:hypothetical protein RJ640_004457 [Escallonia rubra]
MALYSSLIPWTASLAISNFLPPSSCRRLRTGNLAIRFRDGFKCTEETRKNLVSKVIKSSPPCNEACTVVVRLGQISIVKMGGLPTQSPSSAITLSKPPKDPASATIASGPDSKPKKKICCACPDTKKLRDECVVEHGEEACSKWIDAHLKCLRAEGFNV